MMDSSYYGFALGWHLHHVFVVTAIVGIILFVIWAAKLKPAKIKKWFTWLLIVGVIGLLLSSGFSRVGWNMSNRNFVNEDGKTKFGSMRDSDTMEKEMYEMMGQ